ncbi:MAG: hypothetical protein JWQ78_149 [Sediminibacterium sp.]|nr:hypothetical protein [Sediminibacterium sp.]
MNKLTRKIACTVLDCVALPFSLVFLPVMKLVRRLGVEHFPLHRKVFRGIGVFPIRDHYYEPRLVYPAGFDALQKRSLPLDFRVAEQLSWLQELQYKQELQALSRENTGAGNFYLDNPSFGPGDADAYYLVIRNLKPARIIEIGSGHSTLLALKAIGMNAAEGTVTNLTCIEPYEAPWLEEIAGIDLIKQPVEEVDMNLFRALQENDILFIDSSHIIRPGNDVLFIYMELLPALQRGVVIHIHDIFSPRHYRQDWLTGMYRFWNEQYLLEAFLYHNAAFSILCSVNYLKHDFYDEVKNIFTNLSPADEPSSLWLKKIKQ